MTMRQLLDLARENAALKRKLAEILADVEVAQHRLAVLRDAWGDDPTCSSLESEPCDLARGVCARWKEREST
jgi:hypothetical protein